MNQTTAGWITLIAALGMMCGLLSSDIAKLSDWNEVAKPQFIAIFMAHFGTVILAFIGGKIIPSSREPFGRVSDSKLKEINNGDSVSDSNG